MDDVELLADGLFLPLSLCASLSDARTGAIPSGTELMLLSFGALIAGVRGLNHGYQDLLPILVNNAPPLLLLLASSVSGKSGVGDLEYAASMALCYPGLVEARPLAVFPSAFGGFRISAGVTSVALANAILMAWLAAFSKGLETRLKERGLPGTGARAAALAIPVLLPGAAVLVPLFSRFLLKRPQPGGSVPFIPFMFAGFLAARYANVILL
ncbi:MAG: hypothetical protein JTT11_01340 [Candidatus Brockarchaeota archaeon]|nr:hypothetical protein [Candidatus Brockarchaeota archaeon]